MRPPQPLAGTVDSVEPLTDRVRIQVDDAPQAFVDMSICVGPPTSTRRRLVAVRPGHDDLKNSALAHLPATSSPRNEALLVVELMAFSAGHVRSCQVAGEDSSTRHDILKVRIADLEAMGPTMRRHDRATGHRDPLVEK
jgi:hypothetical protein